MARPKKTEKVEKVEEELEVFDNVDSSSVLAEHIEGNPFKIKGSLTALKKISKELSKTNFYTPADEYDTDSNWISTGCTVLNLDLSSLPYGGIQSNRLTQIFGLPSTYKSALAYSLLANAQKLGYSSYYFDVEDTYNPSIAAQYGLDVNDGLTFKLTTKLNGIVTVEDFFDSYLEHLVNLHTPENPALLVVDTFSVLNSLTEENTKIGDELRLGVKSKALARGFRSYYHRMVRAGITLVSIDQVIDNMQAARSPYMKKQEKYTVAGGNSVPFNATTRVWLDCGRKITNKTKQVTGVWVKYSVVKNKNMPSDVSGLFLVKYNYGIDNVASNLVYIKAKLLGDAKALVPSAPFLCLGERGTLKEHYSRILSEKLSKQLEEETVKMWTETRKESGGIV